jgi:hypothetical protein
MKSKFEMKIKWLLFVKEGDDIMLSIVMEYIYKERNRIK